MDSGSNPPAYQQMPSKPDFNQMPPQPAYQQMPPPAAAGMSPARPVIMMQPRMFGKEPVQTTCSNCGQQVVSAVYAENGFFPCFWVPLVIDSCKDFRHICPACNAVMGVCKQA